MTGAAIREARRINKDAGSFQGCLGCFGPGSLPDMRICQAATATAGLSRYQPWPSRSIHAAQVRGPVYQWTLFGEGS